MIVTSQKNAFLGVLMLAAAVVTLLITPRERLSDSEDRVDLEAMVPQAFGVWRLDPTVLPLIAPESQFADAADLIYGQVLNRTYINDRGERIMLTIAWGGNQSDALSVHRPEVCYGAQGFSVSTAHDHILTIDGRKLQMKRLLARNGMRHEPITYWIVIGRRIVSGRVQRKLEQLKYGLTGKIPDGMLVRVSSIGRDEARNFSRQDAFIRDLYRTLDEDALGRIMGNTSPA